jgi:hypothetical protein
MGGYGTGGFRMNAGRKPKGAAPKRVARSAKSVAPVDAPINAVSPPADLPDDERAVWVQLSPHALTARTLTPSTAFAFAQLCKAIVLERALWSTIQADGLTSVRVTTDVTSGEQHAEKKAHALFPRHTAMLVRVEQGLTRFKLSPVGKELAPAEKPEDAFAEFEEPIRHVKSIQ